MKPILFFILPCSLFSITKSELEDRAWDHAREAVVDIGVGATKIGLAVYQFTKGDLPGSLYLQIEAGISLSDAWTEIRSSYESFKDARSFREEREIEHHD